MLTYAVRASEGTTVVAVPTATHVMPPQHTPGAHKTGLYTSVAAKVHSSPRAMHTHAAPPHALASGAKHKPDMDISADAAKEAAARSAASAKEMEKAARESEAAAAKRAGRPGAGKVSAASKKAKTYALMVCTAICKFVKLRRLGFGVCVQLTYCTLWLCVLKLAHLSPRSVRAVRRACASARKWCAIVKSRHRATMWAVRL